MDYYPGLTIGKRDSGIRIYRLGVTNFLADGDRVTGATVSADTGITVDLLETNDDNVKIKITGGTAGETYAVEMVATTLLGEAVDMQINVEVPSP